MAAAPAVAKSTVAVVVRNSQADMFKQLTLPDLEGGSETELPGRLWWGPYTVDGRIVLACQPGGISAFDENGELLWNAELNDERTIGSPAVDGSVIYIATTQGGVRGWNLQTGEVTFEKQLEQPLAAGPVLLNSRIAVAAVDGSILFAERN